MFLFIHLPHIGVITFSCISFFNSFSEIDSSCCCAMTMLVISVGLSFMYFIETWLFPSGFNPFIILSFLTSAIFLVNLCARVIGRGMSSSVSLQAKPNIKPWSPAPCSVILSTPFAMSGLCSCKEFIIL